MASPTRRGRPASAKTGGAFAVQVDKQFFPGQFFFKLRLARVDFMDGFVQGGQICFLPQDFIPVLQSLGALQRFGGATGNGRLNPAFLIELSV